MNIFVGNLSFEANETDVQRVFAAFGLVTSVAIVMEKKGKKSRGFGFVEMPDEQEAQAAIDQLQGKEILGRPINVMPALSKEPKVPPVEKKIRHLAPAANDHPEGLRPGYKTINPRHDPSFKRTGKYKEGRRSLSYLKRRLEAGITAPVPKRRHKSNPMRWRKKSRREVPFVKSESTDKPWQNHQTESKPWKKPEGQLKPWQKNRSGSKPWMKAQSSEGKPWKRTESTGEPKPWKKSANKLKPWRKSSADRAQSGFKKRSSFSKSPRK